MNPIRILSLLRLFIAIICLESCDGIFVQDPIDPRIPQYSEKGYNSAGAFINGEIWRAVADYGFYKTSNIPHLTYFPEKDSLSIYFEGGSTTFGSIVFGLKDISAIQDFKDLTLLHNRKIQLDGKDNLGSCYDANFEGYDTAVPFRGKGQLYLKKVSLTGPSVIQFSGTFSIHYEQPGDKSISVTCGRFDYLLNADRDFEMVLVD